MSYLNARPAAAGALLLAGCSADDAPEVVPVSGYVTDAGVPVANATVTFMPDGGRPSTGSTDAEGRFELRYTTRLGGAVVGNHTVTVEAGGAMPGPPPGESAAAGQTPAPPPGPAAPTEYKWPETVRVDADNTEFEFDLIEAQ